MLQAMNTGHDGSLSTGHANSAPDMLVRRHEARHRRRTALLAAAVCAITELIIGALDRKALGGMNGDISGHMITSGEMAGLLAAAILLG